MSLVIKGQFGLIVDAVREKRPVIHHLTNYVTAGDCANITLCAGASPVMADEAEEVAEITGNYSQSKNAGNGNSGCSS